MTHKDKTGILDGFYDEEDHEEETLDERKQDKPDDINRAFINLPTRFAAPSSKSVYVVHEIRVIYGKTQRRVIGIHDTERKAERQAAEVRHLLVRFLEQHDGRPFQDEMCGGTLVQYWHAGHPMTIVGFKVWVEEVK